MNKEHMRKKSKGIKFDIKKTVSLMLVLVISVLLLFSCGEKKDNGRVDIVCTVFPIYDWLRNIVPENEDVSITLLIKNGTDPHSYSPSPSDIAKIITCDVLVYVGGDSDSWVSDVLAGEVNDSMKEIKLLHMIEEFRDSYETECLADDCHEHNHHHESAYDEHVWLSLKNAKYLCENVADELSEHIPSLSDIIEKNIKTYSDKLTELDLRYENAVESAKRDTLLFADRFPFGYLTKDYGIEHFAAFSGCSADVEASFETVAALAKKVDELSLDFVIILENSSTELADTVISNSRLNKSHILVLDSLQSITSRDIERGESYLAVMEKNLEVLERALA